MENRDKLVKELFIGKVSEIIGYEKTIELLKQANDTFPKCKHDEGNDSKTYAGKEFIGYYCQKCDEVYCESI